jgi:hypothetical protein
MSTRTVAAPQDLDHRARIIVAIEPHAEPATNIDQAPVQPFDAHAPPHHCHPVARRREIRRHEFPNT